MARFSPSGVARVNRCPASAVLPAAYRTSDRARRGKEGHAFLAAVPEIGREAALARAPEEFRADFEKIDLAALPVLAPGAFASEVVLAYNVQTGEGRELARGDDSRSYPDMGPEWILGTADLVGLTADEVVVPDFKFGYADVDPAAENLQLRTYALAAARAYRRTRATVAIIRIPDDGEPRTDVATLEAFDLDLLAESLADLVVRVEDVAAEYAGGSRPDVFPGDHCKWCPAFASCPSNVDLARAVAFDPEGTITGTTRSVALLDPESAAEAYRRAKRVRAVLDAVDAAIETFARQTPLEVAPGVLYGPRPFVREEILPSAAPAVAAVLGADYVAKCGAWSTSKGEIEKGVRAWLADHPGSGQTLKGAKEAVLEECRRMGAVKKTVSFPCKEYREKGGES